MNENSAGFTVHVEIHTQRNETFGDILRTHYTFSPDGNWHAASPNVVEPFYAFVGELLWPMAAGYAVLIELPYHLDH